MSLQDDFQNFIGKVNIFERVTNLEEKVKELEVRVKSLEFQLEELRSDFGNWGTRTTEELFEFKGKLELVVKTLRRTRDYIQANNLVDDASDLLKTINVEHRGLTLNTTLVVNELKDRGAIH